MSTQPPKPNRRWCQFSLLTLLVVMTLFTVTVGWVGSKMLQARQNRERVEAVTAAVVAIEKLGGIVSSEYNELRPQTWLERQFDDPGDADDPVGVLKVTKIRLGYTSGLEWKMVMGTPGWNRLAFITFSPENVDDASLEHVQGMVDLESLSLIGTNVTDAGLEHLNGLKRLQYLTLEGTKVTDEGVKKLQKALPNCTIHR
jgi:hypothetical protein